MRERQSGTECSDVTRRAFVRKTGLGVLGASAVACAPTTKIVVIGGGHKCRPTPSPEDPVASPRNAEAASPESGAPVESPPTPTPSGEMPTLMVGEVIPGLYQTDRIVGEIAVTMDDMPKPHFTDMGLRWLDEFGVTATFFIVGRLAERYPDNVRKIVDAGHELGNHTFTHPNLATLTDIEILDELDRTQDAIDKALGYHYPLRQMRPPYGSPWYGAYEDETIARVARVISTRRVCLTLWSLSTKDTHRDCTRGSMVKGLKQSFDARTGGVLVFHPTRCTKESFRAVMRTALYKEMRLSTTRRFIEQKYGHSLEHLADWSPALAAESGARPTASL